MGRMKERAKAEDAKTMVNGGGPRTQILFTSSAARRSRRFARAVILLLAALLGEAARSPLHADTYQFIISGDPVAAATVDSCDAASAAASLDTGTLSTSAEAQGLEARFRTWLASEGAGLLSTLLRGFTLIIR